MAKKPHFASSVERLAEGSNIPAACGVVVNKAAFCSWADLQWCDLDYTALQTQMVGCKKCLEALGNDLGTSKKYIYMILDGELSRHDSQE
jgi:uncharacterized protein involved in tellurium resistance